MVMCSDRLFDHRSNQNKCRRGLGIRQGRQWETQQISECRSNSPTIRVHLQIAHHYWISCPGLSLGWPHDSS
jgi:hypothetical protein